MAYKVEQECPQCGAPIDLEETDRLLECPYCRVKSFLHARGYLQMVLPHKVPDKELVYAPYLRFKGNVYLCHGQTVNYRIVDVTHLGAAAKGLPPSLGLRPQALKLRFLTPKLEGSFMKPSLGLTEVLDRVGQHTSERAAGKLFYRAYIGEAVSLIYLPLYVENGVIRDGITDKRLARLSEDDEAPGASADEKPWRGLTFLSTLCPQCGWNLDGERDSVVLTCSNCDSAWESTEGRLSQVPFVCVPGQGPSTVYLPFWKTTAKAEGLQIDTFADFIRLTNQPKVVKKEWEDGEMSYWSPAFKIRPSIYLRLVTQLTLSQRDGETRETMPKKRLYPVSMPRSESIQTIKLALANATMTKRKIFPLLPRVHFAVGNSTLVYLPFTETGHDMILQGTRISVNKKALEYGRYL